eukprot:GFKZ01004508.1.p1 GENE.GFKZ01004508.1~~GFKZ01004508.1.p1  ORF type:complete len:148 (+),score=28.06 GFKZ01004508.1:56-445(+)
MGKRKRATKPPPKKKSAKLEKIFDCPFCGHEQTVDCIIERDVSIGRVECRMCGVKYSTIINRLEEEIDVYSKWIDACEVANGGGGDSEDGDKEVESPKKSIVKEDLVVEPGDVVAEIADGDDFDADDED